MLRRRGRRAFARGRARARAYVCGGGCALLLCASSAQQAQAQADDPYSRLAEELAAETRHAAAALRALRDEAEGPVTLPAAVREAKRRPPAVPVAAQCGVCEAALAGMRGELDSLRGQLQSERRRAEDAGAAAAASAQAGQAEAQTSECAPQQLESARERELRATQTTLEGELTRVRAELSKALVRLDDMRKSEGDCPDCNCDTAPAAAPGAPGTAASPVRHNVSGVVERRSQRGRGGLEAHDGQEVRVEPVQASELEALAASLADIQSDGALPSARRRALKAASAALIRAQAASASAQQAAATAEAAEEAAVRSAPSAKRQKLALEAATSRREAWAAASKARSAFVAAVEGVMAARG